MKKVFFLLVSLSSCGWGVTFTPSSCIQEMQHYGPHPIPCAFTITSPGTFPLQNAAFTPGWHWWNDSGTEINSVTVATSSTVYLSCYYCNKMGPGILTPDFQPAKIDTVVVPTTITSHSSWEPLYSNYLRLPESSLPCVNTGDIYQTLRDSCTLSSYALGSTTIPAQGSFYVDPTFGTPVRMLGKWQHDYAVINEFNKPGGVDRYVINQNRKLDELGNNISSQTGIYSLTTGSRTYHTPCEDHNICAGVQFSNLHSDRLYGITGSGTHQYTLGPGTTTVTHDGFVYTPPAGDLTDAGGSTTLSQDDLMITYEFSQSGASISAGTVTISGSLTNMVPGKIVQFYNCSDSSLNRAFAIQTVLGVSSFTILSSASGTGCQGQLNDYIALVDLENQTVLVRMPFEQEQYQPMYIRTIHLSPKDTQTGKYYIINEPNPTFVQSVVASRVSSYTRGSSSFTFEYLGPRNVNVAISTNTACTLGIANTTYAGCFASAHSTELNIGGISYLAFQAATQDQWSGGEDFISIVHAKRLSSTDGGAVSSGQLGGGFAYWNPGLDHLGGSRLAPFVASNGDSTSLYSSQNITGYSGSTATTAGAHGYVIGDTVTISVADFSSTDQSLHGNWVVTSTPSAVTFTTLKTPSSYQANSAITYKQGDDADLGSVQNEILVGRMLPDGRLLQLRRIAKHMSTQFSASVYDGHDGVNDYFAQPHVILSPDGKYVGWTSNQTRGNRNYFYVAETGFDGNLDPDQFTPTTRMKVDASSTTAIFTASVPENQNYVILVSTEPGMLLPISSTVTASVLKTTGTLVSGLSASTVYYWISFSSDRYFAAAGQFTTLPTQSGSSIAYFSAKTPANATSVVLNYGPTASLGSSTSSVSCTAGQKCEASVSGLKGTTLYGQLAFDTGEKSPLTGRMVR